MAAALTAPVFIALMLLQLLPGHEWLLAVCLVLLIAIPAGLAVVARNRRHLSCYCHQIPQKSRQRGSHCAGCHQAKRCKCARKRLIKRRS